MRRPLLSDVEDLDFLAVITARRANAMRALDFEALGALHQRHSGWAIVIAALRLVHAGYTMFRTRSHDNSLQKQNEVSAIYQKFSFASTL